MFILKAKNKSIIFVLKKKLIIFSVFIPSYTGTRETPHIQGVSTNRTNHRRFLFIAVYLRKRSQKKIAKKIAENESFPKIGFSKELQRFRIFKQTIAFNAIN